MVATLKSLVPAAALALLAAPAARADHQPPCPTPAYAPAPRYAPVPVPVVDRGPVYAPRAWQGAPPELRVGRGLAWAQLQREYRELEQARDRFYAGWRGHPGRQRRFEAWYAGRRAELDQRREALARREWGHGGERYAWGRGDHD